MRCYRQGAGGKMGKIDRKNEKQTGKGVVTARKCDCCGHHEVGVTLDSGEYIPLKPGMRVAIINR